MKSSRGAGRSTLKMALHYLQSNRMSLGIEMLFQSSVRARKCLDNYLKKTLRSEVMKLAKVKISLAVTSKPIHRVPTHLKLKPIILTLYIKNKRFQ